MDNSKENSGEFQAVLSELLSNPEIQKMKDIPQHVDGNTLSHSVAVARLSYAIAKKLHWAIDVKALVTGAMLHDYYLYDTRTMPWSDYRHSLIHPKMAAENAKKILPLTRREENMIRSHMWPIPGAPLPRSREAWLVCAADKICAFHEIRAGKKKKKNKLQF